MIRAYLRNATNLRPVTALEGESRENLPVWIDLIDPTPEEDQLVERIVGVSIPTREEMQDIEVSARLYQENGAEFLTITAVAQIHADEPQTTPITFVLKNNILVTVRYAEPRAFTNFAARVQKSGAVACTNGEQVMMGLIEALLDRMADALEKTGADIEAMSRRIFRKKGAAKAKNTSQDLQEVIEKIGQDGDLLTMIRESLVSIHRLLTYHTAVEQEDRRLTKDSKAYAKILYRDVVALTDQTTFLSNKINFMLDATLGLINLQQSQIIKIFSVAAVVFLPPTLVASIYGMNFEYMPELKWMLGYPSALGLMLVSAILPYLYFKYRGWL